MQNKIGRWADFPSPRGGGVRWTDPSITKISGREMIGSFVEKNEQWTDFPPPRGGSSPSSQGGGITDRWPIDSYKKNMGSMSDLPLPQGGGGQRSYPSTGREKNKRESTVFDKKRKDR